MKQRSAGLLAYRLTSDLIEVLLVHPGGPFWKNKDEGAWSIPKGEYDAQEEPLAAAKREFLEETGYAISEEDFRPLTSIKQKSGKWVDAFAIEYDMDARKINSNVFEIEWPPRSGRMQSFPEVDRAEWFDLHTAHKKINPAQAAFLDELAQLLK
ncbi:NUDIX domain-containing protein [Terrimonas sp. NA20]|uniref:NUDIX domain-containing protein n=1 Tax=Terrimonas ginsenosidimutans TaxID=2908004 RepID=A0ABS9KXG9_9BACT|nr:NUDIX domain-containing protein [Terrimonas ginsenosidimutans]MCG2616937.1 NUDIX domain-containing protein [Terrimonas ginsenosidimutans]